jgi:hypothetical protein
MRMICCGHVLCGTNEVTKFSHKLGDESGISIAYYFSGKSESREYMSEVKISYSFGIDRFIAWHEYCHFGAIVICDGED